MRKFSIFTSMLFVLLFCTSHSGYCSMTGPDYQADNLSSPVSVEDIIPGSLTGYLLDRGIDVNLFRPVLLKNGERKLFLFKSASQDEFLSVLKTPEGRGILLLLDITSSSDKEDLIITFDTAEDVYYAPGQSEIPAECIQQITKTIKSFLYVLYDCLIKQTERTCIGSVLDLVTDILFIPIYCRDESPPEE